MEVSGSGEGEFTPVEQVEETQENIEKELEVLEFSEEIEKLDQATFAPEEVVEGGDYKQSEVIETAFVEAIEAQTVEIEPEESTPLEPTVDKEKGDQPPPAGDLTEKPGDNKIDSSTDRPPEDEGKIDDVEGDGESITIQPSPSEIESNGEPPAVTMEVESGVAEAEPEADTSLDAPIAEAEIYTGQLESAGEGAEEEIVRDDTATLETMSAFIEDGAPADSPEEEDPSSDKSQPLSQDVTQPSSEPSTPLRDQPADAGGKTTSDTGDETTETTTTKDESAKEDKP
jgi:hypothetical protein